MDLAPPLTPYWYEPAQDESIPKGLRDMYEGVRLRLAPLTQPQVAEIQSTRGFYESVESQVYAMYKAGCMALDRGREIEGLTIGGRAAQWPGDRDAISVDLMTFAGANVMKHSSTTPAQVKN